MDRYVIDTDSALERLEWVFVNRKTAVAFYWTARHVDIDGPHGMEIENARSVSEEMLLSYGDSSQPVAFKAESIAQIRSFLQLIPQTKECRDLLAMLTADVGVNVELSLEGAIFIGDEPR